jgi:hypothetical protein
MNKEFVPYEQALELKELGFDEPCIACYDKLNMLATYSENLFEPKNYNTSGYCVSSPLYQQAFRFFREKYKLYGSYGQTNDNREEVNGFVIGNFINGMRNRLFADWEVGTYEEAELACLDKLISILKEQQNGK